MIDKHYRSELALQVLYKIFDLPIAIDYRNVVCLKFLLLSKEGTFKIKFIFNLKFIFQNKFTFFINILLFNLLDYKFVF